MYVCIPARMHAHTYTRTQTLTLDQHQLIETYQLTYQLVLTSQDIAQKSSEIIGIHVHI